MAAFKLTKVERKTLDDALAAYQTAAEEFFQALADIESEWREAYEARTEKWQASDAGCAANDLLDSLGAMIDEQPEAAFDFDQLS